MNHTGSRGGFVVLAAIAAAGLVLLTAVSGALRRLAPTAAESGAETG